MASSPAQGAQPQGTDDCQLTSQKSCPELSTVINSRLSIKNSNKTEVQTFPKHCDFPLKCGFWTHCFIKGVSGVLRVCCQLNHRAT